MIKKLSFLVSVFALLLCFGTIAFGQETTGDIEVTVKDPNGAVVPNVSVTIESSQGTSTGGFKRTITTDGQGFIRLLKVAPGLYTITAAATGGFAERIIQSVPVTLGKVTPVSIVLGVANNQNIVTVNTTDVNPIDTSSTKIETTISSQTAELLPKGISFASILKLSAATRPEPLSGQFQIDGASGSENVFIIDGQEVTNVRTGILDATSDLPFQLVQEVQIKSSGFEAEYGGATGGVVSLVTKSGSNQLRGELGAQFRPGGLQTRGRDALILNTFNQAEYFPDRKDKSLGFFPSASLGGPIIKNRVWFYGSYTPQIFNRQRTITYVDQITRVPTGIVQTYRSTTKFEYAFLKISAQPFSRLNLNAAYTWNPLIVNGSIPAYSSALNATLPNGNGLTGSAYSNQTGGRNNSQSITGQAVWTPTNNLVLSFRGGHYFLNEKSGSYGIGDVTIPRLTCSNSSPMQFPAGFGCVRNFNNGLAVNSNVLFDATTRNTFDADATFIFNAFGRNELKGGYQYNGIGNQLLSQTRDQIVLRFGQTVGSYSGVSALPSSPGALGAGLLRRFSEQGNVSSKNEGIFIQDKWQPTSRLTFNLGIRTERENVPSFAPGLKGINFSFGDKIAPRLGVAFDLTGDGKTKVSAFYGWFYDRFKYELPRGSFGGNYFHDFFYEIFPGDTLATFTVANIVGNGVGIVGGACPTNTTTPLFGRVRCDFDFRVPSNTDLGVEFGAIDPNIKAFRQSELTFTFERALGRKFTLAARYTRKNVDYAVEDAGFLTSGGSEAYVIGNPGFGLYKQIAEANGLLVLKPQRTYNALEIRLERQFANNFFFNFNYTYSRLYGNYSGLASSDEDGRTSPNVNRFFDLPHAGYTVNGGPDNGLLPTDRPHVFKFYGAYNLNWKEMFNIGGNNETTFGLFTTFTSGTPITTTVDILNIDTIVVSKRGDLGRTEMFTQTDFSIRHRFRFGRDNRFALVFEGDAINLFNESNEVSRNNLLSIQNFDLRDPRFGLITATEAGQPNAGVLALARFQRNGAPIIGTIAAGGVNPTTGDNGRYPLFNLTSGFQGGREIRLGMRFSF
ncbi:TonB-dependent receptor [soil metagenome]